MPKTLVVGCDGTWNDPASETNIHWLTQAAVRDDRQLVFYDAGVGTAGDFDAKVGGNFGVGLSENVREAYAFIRDHYEPGDAVFLLGFSRGAFTVRSLAGFMQLVGRLGSADAIEDAYVYYRIHEPGEDDNIFERWFRPAIGPAMPVRFLGVFDTVGALGLPFEIEDKAPDVRETVWGRLSGWLDELGDRVRRPVKGFHNTRLGDQVETAAQALAIDETRGFFVPTLWTAAPGKALKRGETGDSFEVRQSVDQVWFAGSHIDVGGGDTTTPRPERLCNLPLLWMAEKAAAADLRFADGFLDELRTWSGTLATALQHDPMTEKWRRLHTKTGIAPVVRPIGNPARRAASRGGRRWPPVETPEAIHHSLRRRLGQRVVVRGEAGETTTAYAPTNLVETLIEPPPGR
jgi:uncharacterized protein (DUF2235 family)